MSLLWKVLPFVLFLYWSYVLVSQSIPWIFLDFVNLIFHEAGHVIFIPFGNFMRVLGGSLLQCIIPFGIGLYFYLSRQFYSATFCLFWLGNNIISVSVYIKDAQMRVLPLLGGDIDGHDWNWILNTLGMLQYDQQIGGIVWLMGAVCLFGSLVAYGYLFMKEYVGE